MSAIRNPIKFMIEPKFFRLKENGTDVRTEIIAGLTTFLSMAGVLAINMMPFTFSIANGILFGMLSYVILKVSEGRIREIKPVMWVSAAMFALYIVLG